MRALALLTLALATCDHSPAASLLAAPPAAALPKLVITGIPQDAQDASVKGAVTLQTSLGDHAGGDLHVTYSLGGRPFCGPLTVPPYSCDLDTRSLWDGPETVTAVATDGGGKPVGEPGVLRITIANGETTIATSLSPDTTPARGKVHWGLVLDRPFPQAEIDEDIKAKRNVKKFEGVVFAIDGVFSKVQFGSQTPFLDMDTTALPNGAHELFAAAYSYKLPVPPVAMSIRTVQIDNGHTLMAVRSKWRDVFLAPGEKVALEPTARYTDGAPGPLPCKPTYKLEVPDVASVSEDGVVTGLASGAVTLTLTCGERVSTASIFVEGSRSFPHFSNDGHMLTTYDPKRSFFVRSAFALGMDTLASTPQLADQLKFAGVNTLTNGFYSNPAESPDVHDFGVWRTRSEAWIDRMVNGPKALGMRVLLTGDDLARTPRELASSVDTPWTADAIRLAVTKARDSHAVVGIEMVDEASMVWGPTPHPTGGAWLKKSPPITDDAFVRLMGIVNSVPGRPPITWPVLGTASPPIARNWMGDPSMSDYATEFWDTLDWARVYPWGTSLSQEIQAMARSVVGRSPVLQHDRPQLLQATMCGPGPRVGHVTAEIMYGVAVGVAGIRAYKYDRKSVVKPGRNEADDGASPYLIGTDRWWAMASAYAAIELLQPWIFQPRASALDLGAQIVTGARVGPTGKMFIAVNDAEALRTVTVDLSPYGVTGRAEAVEIHVTGPSTFTKKPAWGTEGAPSETITLGPGESVIWVFPEGGTVAPAPIQIVSPLPDETLSGPMRVTLAAPAPSTGAVRIVIDGLPRATLAPGASTIAIDTTPFKAGIWHGLAAQVVSLSGAVLGEARTAFRPQAPGGGSLPPH